MIDSYFRAAGAGCGQEFLPEAIKEPALLLTTTGRKSGDKLRRATNASDFGKGARILASFDDHQLKTQREIPVVVLDPIH